MPHSRTLFTNAHLFNGYEFLHGTHDVLIADGRVAQVGQGIAPDDCEVVDLGGNTLLPGLVDLHVHLMTTGAGNVTKRIYDPFALPYYESIQTMRATLAAGITSVRDAGGTELGTKIAVDRGIVEGPRMKLAINIMSQTGGHGDGICASGVDLSFMPVTPGRPKTVVDGVEGVTRVTRELFRAGADQIKICSTGGVLSEADDPRHSQFTVAEIEAIVAEAAAQGTYVMSHAQGTQGIKNALRAGVRTIEHGIYLDDEAIELFKEKDAWLVPTLVAPLSVIRAAEGGKSSMSQAVIDKAKRVVDDHRNSIAKAIEAGVNIAMGTDSGVGPHGENLEELWQMTQLGMDLAGALAASSGHAGQFIGEGVGRIEEGSVGDAVVLDYKLTDTAQLEDLKSHIKAVYKDGKQVAA